jgi:hypothetical protein
MATSDSNSLQTNYSSTYCSLNCETLYYHPNFKMFNIDDCYIMDLRLIEVVMVDKLLLYNLVLNSFLFLEHCHAIHFFVFFFPTFAIFFILLVVVLIYLIFNVIIRVDLSCHIDFLLCSFNYSIRFKE